MVKRQLIRKYHGPISGEGLEEKLSGLEYFIQVFSRFERNDQNREVSESDESAAFSSSLLLRQVEDAGDSAVIWIGQNKNYTLISKIILLLQITLFKFFQILSNYSFTLKISTFISICKPAKCRKINLDKLRFSPITSRISSNV